MEQMMLVLQGLIPVLVAVGVGALLRHRGVLKEEVEHGMMQMVVQVLMPALILANIIGAESLKDFSEVATVAGFGFVALILGFVAAYFLAGAFGMQRGNGKRTFAVASGIQNYGFMGVPLMLSIFPEGELLGVLFTHNVGVELAMWTVGVSLMQGDKSFGWRLFMRAPIIAVTVGLFINALGIDSWFVGVPMKSLELIGAAAIPIALVVIGAGLVELLRKEKFHWNVAIAAVLVRLALIPALMIAAAYFLPVSEQLRKVIVIQAAMPAAMMPIVLARHFGGKPEVAVQVTVATTIVSFVSMPMVILVGMKVFGF